MNENRYAVGVDIGTSEVRIVVASVPPSYNRDNLSDITIVGVGSCPSQGLRKGTIVDIKKVIPCIDKAAGLAEEMCGFDIHEGLFSINGTHIVGRKSHGLITVDGPKPIDQDDVDRVIGAASLVKMPPNTEVIDARPHLFKVDDQDDIRDPIDMEGLRLEVDIYMVTALKTHIKNLSQVAEQGNLVPSGQYVPAGLAAAEVALTERQRESGCVMIDIGHSVTNMVVYDESNVIDVKVLPIGSSNITNDLAVGLRTDLDVAEKLKLEHAVASSKFRRGKETQLSVKVGDGVEQRKLDFQSEIVDDIVEARLEELFELIEKELKRIKKQAGLPGGVILTGGGANLRGIADYAKLALGMNAVVYKQHSLKGVADSIKDPSWTTALGLAVCVANSGIDMGDGYDRPRHDLFGGLINKIVGFFHRGDDR